MNNLAVCHEPARDLPVTGSFDVVVVGGGIAGVAAALAAARSGVSVCLIEKLFALGGLATLGNVISYLPLCDGRGRQVMAGLTEELLKLSVAGTQQADRVARFDVLPDCWRPGGDPAERRKHRYYVDFNPTAFFLALEKAVVDADISLMYDTHFADVRREDGRITHVIIENKSGRQAIAARMVIDATGDADVCHAAGEETESLDSNVLAGWFYTLQEGALKLHMLTRKFCHNATREGGDGPFFRGDVAADVTGHILGSREMLRERLATMRERKPGVEIQPIQAATFPGFRMTRRLVGSYSLLGEDKYRWFEDAVGLTSDWRKAGPVWSIPLRCLVAPKTHNLAVAGRCISAATSVWDVTRSIPACGVTGEAAGVAVSLALERYQGDLGRTPAAEVAACLRSRGNLLAPEYVAELPAEEATEERDAD